MNDPEAGTTFRATTAVDVHRPHSRANATGVSQQADGEERVEYVAVANSLLAYCDIAARVRTLRECNVSMFVLLVESVFAIRLSTIVRNPHTLDDHIENAAQILGYLVSDEVDLDIGEVTPEALAKVPLLVFGALQCWTHVIVDGSCCTHARARPPGGCWCRTWELMRLSSRAQGERAAVYSLLDTLFDVKEILERADRENISPVICTLPSPWCACVRGTAVAHQRG